MLPLCSSGFNRFFLPAKPIIFFAVIFFARCDVVFGYPPTDQDVIIIDSSHYSNTFGEIRNFRIFLPPGYFKNHQRYPVIYFLHGWSQRYFGDGAEGQWTADKGNQNNGDNISKFVSNNQVIVVKPDGYNRGPNESYYIRPYNIAPVETFRQFPIYFPELINFIDANYRTIGNRRNRGIAGLSMGGFMAFWIGGKYPDLFSAVGSFCGSPELVVGPKDFPVEYRHADMYKNYGGVNVRLNYGARDFIRSYHQDLEKIWLQVMDNFESKVYNAEHSSCGLNEMFGFFMNTFKKAPVKLDKWDHIDVYPDFSVWGYHITSDRNTPGFTILENVNERGFRCSIREFLPDGPIKFLNTSITTAPIYKKNKLYHINDIEITNLNTTQQVVRSDNSGRLKLFLRGGVHEVGINQKADNPNICIAKIKVVGPAKTKADVPIEVTLINKGGSVAKKVKARLFAIKKTAKIKQGESLFGNIAINEIKSCETPLILHVESDSIEIEKFKLIITDDNHSEWTETFEISVIKDAPEIKDFEIADGKIFTVAKSGNDAESIMLGKGNGDGIVNPGESIELLVKDGNKYRRTYLSCSDKYINPFGINNRVSDDWANFDWVGASAKYSIPLIASDCPQNHQIVFYAEYWLPDLPMHIKKQGFISIVVRGNDSTPPIVKRTFVRGDNTLEILVNDGSTVQKVKATLIKADDPMSTFDIELKDDGLHGDRVECDNVFARKIPEKKFSFYRIIVEAIDSFGNKSVEEENKQFVIY